MAGPAYLDPNAFFATGETDNENTRMELPQFTIQPLSCKEQKSLLLTAIEEQTSNIALYESTMTKDASKGQEDHLYESLLHTLNSLKLELHQLRLGGDTFKLRGFAINNNKNRPPFSPPSKSVVRKLHFVEVSPDDQFSLHTHIYCTQPIVPSQTSNMINFNFKVVQEPDGNQLYLIQNYDAIKYIDDFISAKSSKSKDKKELTLLWKDSTKWTLMFDMSDSGVVDEFEAVLDAKLKRWRFCKLECVRQLQKALERTQIAYNQSDLMHEQMLSQLWQTVFPEEPLTGAVSKQWKRFGFQSSNPATDFRGMGLLGLEQLLYIATTRTEWVRSVLEGNRNYPWATAAINVTNLIISMLGVTVIRSAVDSSPVDGTWDSPLLNFFTRVLANASQRSSLPQGCAEQKIYITTSWALEKLASDQPSEARIDGIHLRGATPPPLNTLNLFKSFISRNTDSPNEPLLEEIYCETMMLLDHLFVASGADYMDFPAVIAKTKQRVSELLARRPFSLQQLKAWFRETILAHTNLSPPSSPTPTSKPP